MQAERNKIMKRRKEQVIFLLLIFSLLLCGCRKHNDGPPDPGTPEPSPLAGVFVSEHGSFTFDGDGKTVLVDLDDELNAYIPDGTMEYFFKWGSFGLCRYDVASDLQLSMDGRQYDFKVRSASENRVSVDYRDEAAQYELDFVREGDGKGEGEGTGEAEGAGAGEAEGVAEMQDISLESLQGEWSDLNGSTKMFLRDDQLTVQEGEYSQNYTVVLIKEGNRPVLANKNGRGFGFMSDLEIREDGSLVGWEMVMDADSHSFHFMREEQIAAEKEIVDLSTEMPKTIESMQIRDFSLNFCTTDGRGYGLDESLGGAAYGWTITRQEDGSYWMDFSQSYASYMGIGFHGTVSEEYVAGLAEKINELGLPSLNGYHMKNNVSLPGYCVSVDYESDESLLILAEGNAADECVFDLPALVDYAFLVVGQE